jgi:hypothetical protein
MSMTRNEFMQEAAIRALQGLIMATPQTKFVDTDILANFAIEYARVLTKKFPDIGEFYELRTEEKHELAKE